jgi:hypothetical protein
VGHASSISSRDLSSRCVSWFDMVWLHLFHFMHFTACSRFAHMFHSSHLHLHPRAPVLNDRPPPQAEGESTSLDGAALQTPLILTPKPALMRANRARPHWMEQKIGIGKSRERP